jgi:hypothetical protein
MTAPNYGGLGGGALNPAKVVVTDVYIAPWNTTGGAPILYSAGIGANGKFVPIGRLQNNSWKHTVTKGKYQVKNGLPEIAIEEFTVGMEGKFSFSAIEITGKLYELSNGLNGLGTPIFNTPPCTATVAAQIPAPSGAATVTTATVGGTVLAGTYLVAYTYVNASGETTISPQTPVTTTGTTSTITVTLPAVVPAIATAGANVYISAIGGAAGSEKLQGNIATGGTVFTLTAPPATVTAIPGANTTGPATTAEFINLTGATGPVFLPNYHVQCTVNGVTEYTRIQAVTGSTGSPILQLFPRLSGVPANGSTVTLCEGFDVAAGGSDTQYYTVMCIAQATDGSQVIRYVPKASFGDTKDENPSGKELFLPIEGMMYGQTIAGLNGPYLMRTITLSPRMALVNF